MARTWPRRDLHRHGTARSRSSCPSGKIRFRTREAADQAIADIEARGHTNTGQGKPQRSYCCPECDGWHVSARKIPPRWAS